MEKTSPQSLLSFRQVISCSVNAQGTLQTARELNLASIADFLRINDDMKKKTSKTKSAKPPIKVRDLKPRKDAKGGLSLNYTKIEYK